MVSCFKMGHIQPNNGISSLKMGYDMIWYDINNDHFPIWSPDVAKPNMATLDETTKTQAFGSLAKPHLVGVLIFWSAAESQKKLPCWHICPDHYLSSSWSSQVQPQLKGGTPAAGKSKPQRQRFNGIKDDRNGSINTFFKKNHASKVRTRRKNIA